MEYKGFLDGIKDYIEDTLPTYLAALDTKYKTITISDPNKYVVSEYPDVDMNGEAIVVYLLTPEFAFEELSNESQALECDLEVYVTFKKAPEATLSALSMIYAEAFFNMIKADRTLGGSVDYSIISRTKIYDGIEGSLSTKAIFISIKVAKEI